MANSSSFFKTSFWILAAALAAIFLYSRQWQEKPIIEWDITLYYSYLPATFIYNDYHLHNIEEEEWGQRQFYMNEDADGNQYVKMTSGLAILYSPFFLGAHLYAISSENFAANAFSAPYEIAILLSALVFALAGLWCLGKFLMHYFPAPTAALATIAIFLGTNMPYYSLVSPMSHAYNFALLSFILLQSQLYLKRQAVWRALAIGMAAGLLVLIRPTNLLALIFPAMLILYRWRQLNTAILLRHLGLAVVMAFIMCIPQLLYWKHMTGNWLIYSYNDESFFLTDPEIWKGLFSYRKGWFTYSPLLFLALLGFPFLIKKYPRLSIAALATLVPAVWVTFSWWCWWYGGGFGARPMIDYLPLMALPLAALTDKILRARLWLKIPYFLSVGFLCFWSLFMNWQFSQGMIHYDSMSKELYWDQFLKAGFAEDFWQKLDPPDYEKALKGEE